MDDLKLKGVREIMKITEEAGGYKKEYNQDSGWIQCTECGNGFEIYRYLIEAGDVTDRQVCDHCGIGLMIIDWTYLCNT